MTKKPKRKKQDTTGKRVLSKADPKRVEKGKDMYGYGEQKKSLNLSVTPTTKKGYSELSKIAKVSISEFIEGMYRSGKAIEYLNETLDKP